MRRFTIIEKCWSCLLRVSFRVCRSTFAFDCYLLSRCQEVPRGESVGASVSSEGAAGAFQGDPQAVSADYLEGSSRRNWIQLCAGRHARIPHQQ